MADVTTVAASGGILALIMGMLIAFLVIFLIVYIYAAITLMATGKRLRTPNPWLAWIPIANIYLMTQMIRVSGWWTLLILAGIIPIIGSLIMLAAVIFAYWKISEKVGYPGWFGILMIVPIVNFVIMGLLAWGTPKK